MTTTEPRSDRLMEVVRRGLACERTLLGIAIQNPSRIPEIMGSMREDDWERTAHRQTWQLLRMMWQDRQSIDLVTVVNAIVAQARPADFGGIGYVTSLPDRSGSGQQNLGPLLEVLDVRRQLRALRRIGERLHRLSSGHAELGQSLSLANAARRAVSELQAAFIGVGGRAHTCTMLDAIHAGIEERREAQRAGVSTKLTTGLHGVDDVTGGGVARKALTVVAARPGMGKTALEGGMASRQAQDGKQVGVFSLEMTRVLLGDRTWASGLMLDLYEIGRGQHDDNPKALHWLESNADWLRRIHVYDGPRIDIDQLVSQTYQWHAEFGLDAVYIDYLGLIKHAPAERLDLSIGESVKAIRDLGKELNAAMVLLAQLNRELTKRKAAKAPRWPGPDGWIEAVRHLFPQPEQLRNSGETEQHIDLMLSPTRAASPVVGFDRAGLSREVLAVMDQCACIDIPKNRQGPTGTVPVHWDGSTTTFWDSPPDH